MARTHTRLIGAVAALIAAGLAGFSLRSQQATLTTIAARNPTTDVRTQVIRRTIHITRHEHARHGIGPSAGTSGVSTRRAIRGPSPVHTGASGSHTVGAGTTGSAASAAVTTRASTHGSGASTNASGGVTTRSSGGHGGEGGDGGGDRGGD
jgi:hypothetical protein